MPDYAVDENATIYIVDPDERHCETISALMQRLGYRTVSYSNAEELLDSLATPPFKGCVISEMRLPGMNGLDLFTTLRERRVGLPFIILTSDSDLTRAVSALHRKVSDYVVKPVVERDLITRVRDALRTIDDGRVKAIG
ncbi:MAG: response regulator [Gammaproteobacteria bacterium]|nr:response regulator [Gammaproteobacteria bacterium]